MTDTGNHGSLDYQELLTALRQEAELEAKPRCFQVKAVSWRGPVCNVEVDAEEPGSSLREALEGATAWWPEPERGSADVLAVIPETSTLTLRFVTGKVPTAGQLYVYPVRFLHALGEVWEREGMHAACRAALNSIQHPVRDASARLDARVFRTLRASQRDAFVLPSWTHSYLWGPPGTGKTFTLGRMLAQYLQANPQARVLLLSTTNAAVDLALCAVDDGLREAGTAQRTTSTGNNTCVRVGNRFAASMYKDRQHLLPSVDEAALRRLVELEGCRPEKGDTDAYAAWHLKVEDSRRAIRQRTCDVIARARLAAMTTTLAAFQLDALRTTRSYDLVVFDEASQVGIAHALPITTLGARCLYAGDPRQLAPVCRTNTDAARRWLGRSIVELIPESSRAGVMLTEQSRMARPIGQLVSDVFYDGRLRVAADAEADPRWRARRAIASTPGIGSSHACVRRVEQEAHAFSPKYGGPIRYESACGIAELGRELTATGTAASDILVVTPFHSQRTLINQQLRKAEVRGIRVSTVHRAQGSECHTVIFDPVHANSDFFTLRLDSERLVNVAISRAMARLVIFLAPTDLQNPLLERLANVLDPPRPVPGSLRIQDLVGSRAFPANALGRVVQMSDTLCVRCTRLLSGTERIEGVCVRSGRVRVFDVSFLRKKHAHP